MPSQTKLDGDGLSKPICVPNTFFCHVCEIEIPVGKPVYRAHDKSFCSVSCRDEILQEFSFFEGVYHYVVD